MTPPTNPVEVEGNIWEIDFPNRYFTLSDKQHKPFIKVFWKFQHEKDTRILKQKAGYYEAPIVEMEDPDIGGGLKEAWLVGLPYLERPADYPRIPKPGKGSNGSNPRNDRAIIYQTAYKECCETARHHLLQLADQFDEAECNRVMDWALTRAKADAKDICNEVGV